jgi:hypothetical protein
LAAQQNKKFIAKPNSWFDEGTQAALIDSYCHDLVHSSWHCSCGGNANVCGMGLFVGLREGKLDEEVCTFCEFDII